MLERVLPQRWIRSMASRISCSSPQIASASHGHFLSKRPKPCGSMRPAERQRKSSNAAGPPGDAPATGSAGHQREPEDCGMVANGSAELCAEIQVRTVLQHAWAAIDHRLNYKRANEIPVELKRQLFRISALLEVADDQFESVRLAAEHLSTSYEQSVSAGELEPPIDRASVSVFVERSPRARYVDGRRIASWIRRRASAVGGRSGHGRWQRHWRANTGESSGRLHGTCPIRPVLASPRLPGIAVSSISAALQCFRAGVG
jgi:hypothetical protein